MGSVKEQTYWQAKQGIVGPATVKDFQSTGQQDTRDAFESYILAHSRKGARFLDAGCNTGISGWRLYEKGYEGYYTGLDNNPQALVLARNNVSHPKANFIESDIIAVPKRDQYFDLVLSKDVIEHLPYYIETLTELARVTKHALILSSFLYLTNQPDRIIRNPAGFYHNNYNRSKLLKFLAKLGFSSSVLHRGRHVFTGNDGETHADEVLIFTRTE